MCRGEIPAKNSLNSSVENWCRFLTLEVLLLVLGFLARFYPLGVSLNATAMFPVLSLKACRYSAAVLVSTAPRGPYR